MKNNVETHQKLAKNLRKIGKNCEKLKNLTKMT